MDRPISTAERRGLGTIVLAIPDILAVLFACAAGKPEAQEGAKEILRAVGLWEGESRD